MAHNIGVTECSIGQMGYRQGYKGNHYLNFPVAYNEFLKGYDYVRIGFDGQKLHVYRTEATDPLAQSLYREKIRPGVVNAGPRTTITELVYLYDLYDGVPRKRFPTILKGDHLEITVKE